MRSRLFVLLLALLILPTIAQGAITKGPYLQNLGREGVTICFETDEPGPGLISWGPTDQLGTDVASIPKTYDLSAYTRYQHKVRIDSLEMDATYHYTLKHGTDASSVYEFRTFPDAVGSSVIAIYGDSRGGTVAVPNVAHEEVIAAMTDDQPSLLLNTGDLVGSGEQVEDWDYMFHADKNFMASVPLMPVFGNHENGLDTNTMITGDMNWKRLFDTGSSDHPTYYSFDFANVHVIVLDVTKFWTLLLPSAAQMMWLIDDLIADELNPHTNFVLAAYHYPAFTFKEGRTPDIVSAAILEPFLRDKVDAFLYGHDHFYARSTLYGNPHVVTGGGGAPLYDFVADPTIYPWHEYHERSNHYMIANIEPQQIEFSVIRTPDLAVIDSFIVESDVLPESYEEADDDDDDDTSDDDDDVSDDDDAIGDDDDATDDDDSVDDDDDTPSPDGFGGSGDDSDEGCCG
jgi:Calcineurin-like phosphoesterase/Purple acid Phosphatase, N-terminal domain